MSEGGTVGIGEGCGRLLAFDGLVEKTEVSTETVFVQMTRRGACPRLVAGA